jgi:hypothetical protein
MFEKLNCWVTSKLEILRKEKKRITTLKTKGDFLLLLLIGSLAFTICGILLLRRDAFVLGLGLLFTGAFMYYWSLKRLRNCPLSQNEVQQLREYLLPSILAIVSFSALLAAIFLSTDAQEALQKTEVQAYYGFSASFSSTRLQKL